MSNTGKVRSVDRYINAKNNSRTFIKGIERKPQKNRKGYLYVTLSKHSTSYTKLIHRLVAEAFIPNPHNLPQVNHIDTNKTNNNVSNLEWITELDNIRHAFANGCFKKFSSKQLESVKNNLKKANEIRKIKVVQLLGNRLINIFDSLVDAAKYNNINNSSHISSCCKNERKKCGGYNWEYYNDFIEKEIEKHMNKVIISGNLTRDPEISYSTGENANAVVRFTVACQRRFKNSDGVYEADFPSCVAFGSTAEFINNNFKKGDRIEIVGEIRTGSYTNKDGVKVYTKDVLATEAGFGGKKSSNQEDTNQNKKPKDTDWMNAPAGDEDVPW